MTLAKTTQNVDLEGLRSLFKSSETAKVLFQNLAKREKNSLISKVERMQSLLANEGIAINRSDVIWFFQELERLNCGKFRKSRTLKGGGYNPARFEWRVELISVGRAAIGEAETVSPTNPEHLSTPEDDTTGVTIKHPYQLRPNLKITIELPADFSSREAQRVSDFVKTLPFDLPDQATS